MHFCNKLLLASNSSEKLQRTARRVNFWKYVLMILAKMLFSYINYCSNNILTSNSCLEECALQIVKESSIEFQMFHTNEFEKTIFVLTVPCNETRLSGHFHMLKNHLKCVWKTAIFSWLFQNTLKYLIIVHVRIIDFWVKFHPI